MNRIRATRHHVFSIETVYALFLFAGVYNSARPLQHFPINITLFFGILTAVVALHYFIKSGVQFTQKRVGILGLFIIMVTYGSLSGLWSPSSSYYLQKLFRLTFISGLALIVPLFIISNSIRRIRRLGSIIILLSFVSATIAIYQFVTGELWSVAPLGAGYLTVGRVYGVAILTLLALTIYAYVTRKLTLILGAIFVITVILAALLIVGARGPFVATVISCVTFFALVGIYSDRNFSKKSIVSAATSTILVFSGVLLAGTQFRGVQRILLLFDGPGSSLGSRFEFYHWTITELNFPSVIYGHGLSSWPVIQLGVDRQLYPHNLFLELLFELGLVGIIIMFLLVTYSAKGVISQVSMHDTILGALLVSLLVYMFINVNITGDLGTNRFLFFVIGLFGVHPHIIQNKAVQKNK